MPETQIFRCQWGDNANLATPVFHPVNPPQTERHGGLMEDKRQVFKMLLCILKKYALFGQSQK